MWSTDTNNSERPGAAVITARALADADGRPLKILMHEGEGPVAGPSPRSAP